MKCSRGPFIRAYTTRSIYTRAGDILYYEESVKYRAGWLHQMIRGPRRTLSGHDAHAGAL